MESSTKHIDVGCSPHNYDSQAENMFQEMLESFSDLNEIQQFAIRNNLSEDVNVSKRISELSANYDNETDCMLQEMLETFSDLYELLQFALRNNLSEHSSVSK